MRQGRAERRCQRLSIDKLVNGTPWTSRPHADFLYLSGNRGVVVEETGRPEHRDLVKVRTSLEMLRTSSLVGDVEAVAGIIHYKRSDTMFNKMLLSEARRRPPILPANCYRKLYVLLEELLGCKTL